MYNPLFKSNYNRGPLHFMGKSIQKNTESILKSNIRFTLHDPDFQFKNIPTYINHIQSYMSDINIHKMLNSHNTHICCSLYESWGHYLFEGLSTGANIICSDIPIFREVLDDDLVHFLPTKKLMNISYKYCNTNIYPFREAHFIESSDLAELINNFQEKGTARQRRDLYRNIMNSNKTKLLDFFNNI